MRASSKFQRGGGLPGTFPTCSGRITEEALEYLASIELIELCHEAKMEHCRATRDLSSCGRYVQHVLVSCGHASLCAECSQRCDVCPICRTSIPKNGCKLRPRLYNMCIEAGLLSERHDDRFQEKEQDEKHLMADVQRLYSLFDVALENNLVSLVCHYITDVCMDESAVSSDPILAFLLDEVVVKDWCKQKFRTIISNLREIYVLGVEGMDSKLSTILKFGLQLTGLSNVMEVLESSSMQTSASHLPDLHHLSDSILKAKQHLEVMTWCIRHRFLENIRSRHLNSISWSFQLRERKAAAVKRAWPDFTGSSGEHKGSTLFIEDALSNLTDEQDCEEEFGELDISCLQVDRDGTPVFLNSSDGMSGTYPFKNVRAAADILFLQGASDMMVAKQAIFLYYLFDRHWTIPDLEWKHIIDDFAASFGINRHSVLESLVFYLLDDHTEQALQAACPLLPEIASPETHPKIAQVLLQRQRPDIVLMVLRCSGHDGFSGYANSKQEIAHLISLGEAVTAVRVRVECGLLTAAFMYQRMHCIKVKEDKIKHESQIASLKKLKSQDHSWIYQVEILVSELCSLCIRRNLVDRMIELPWNCDEEKFLCKCLYENACQNPSAMSGSLLVVFYLQRHRYVEAYQVDRKLRGLEDTVTEPDEVVSRMRLISQWRAGLVDKSTELLPEVQRLQAKTGKLDGVGFLSPSDGEVLYNILSDGMSPNSILQAYPSTESSLVLQSNINSLLPKETPTNRRANSSSPVKHSGSQFSGISVPPIFPGIGVASHQSYSTIQRTGSAVHGNLSANPRKGERLASNGIMTRELRLKNDSQRELPNCKSTAFRKETSYGMLKPVEDANMDFAWSNSKRGSPAQDLSTKGGPRWRSDESSDDEMEVGLERVLDHEFSFLKQKSRYDKLN